uniref:NADP-dependent oxidoreductase domain-containing protein n=1 Tax=Vitis vinifera TaxID=29760 RepID=F6HF95_VITVI
MISIPEMTLGSTGKAIPLVGMVTTVYPFAPSETMIDSILTAIELGYRHFDCVAAYLSEKPLGEAIKKAVKLGLIKSRDELFITSKLWCSDAHHDRVLPALQNTLNLKPGNYELPVNKDGHLPIDLGSVWKAMEDFQKLSLTKAIGVSNFSCNKLEELLQTASILPAVNQVKMNPL